jgi:hypothetical protein
MSPSPSPLSEEALNKIMTAAQQPRVITAERVQTPTLIVMLGSTPALAGLELMRHMLTLSREDRRRVSFVHIDTDDEPHQVVDFRKEHEGGFQEFRLRIAVPVGIDYVAWPEHPMHTYIPAKMPEYFATGAGGIRNNGHVAAAFDCQKIVQTLESALNAIAQLETTYTARRIYEVQVNIVAFLGGGTGSGILSDVAVILRSLLNNRQYQQRLNLFCILPDRIQGATNNDISWRKSNATACLLELLALSLAAGNPATGGRYDKYLFNERYALTSDPIANEVYLIGQTQMKNADDVARIVGLDLFQRITDVSGVGQLEHSTWVNRRSLGARDDRGQPAMFGTSCPMEVRFPAEETAKAFAQLSASLLLPHLVGREPPPPDVDERMRTEWRNEWREIAILTPNIEGRELAVRPPQEFFESEFEGATADTFHILWSELVRRRDATDENIKDAIRRKYEEEAVRFSTPPTQLIKDGLTPLTRQINHLGLLQAEYETVLDTLKRNPSEEEPQRPQELEDRFLRGSPFPLPSPVENARRQRQIAEICSEYNAVLRIHTLATRYHLLLQAAEALLKQVEKQLGEALSWYKDKDLDKQGEELATRGRVSAAWNGKLDMQHPHQYHIFDLPMLRGAEDERSIATERLYLWATFPPAGEHQPGQRTGSIGQHIAKFVDACMNHLSSSTSRSGSETRSNGQDAADLEAYGKERLADRVVRFFTDYYRQEFQTMNLFKLLEIGSGQGEKAPISRYLYQHLQRIRNLMSSLIAFEETLWHEGSTHLDTSLYLSMRWEANSRQEQMLDLAVKDLGSLTKQNQTLWPANMIDPHRLQVSYGQHGISLATVPDFYKDSNSAMADYLSHQGRWFGSHDRIPPMPAPASYGQNQMPTHSSGEMERLVCSPHALGYQSNQPHAQRYGTNLRGRVIREQQRLQLRPDWESSNGNSAQPNGGSDGRGQSVNVPQGFPFDR